MQKVTLQNITRAVAHNPTTKKHYMKKLRLRDCEFSLITTSRCASLAPYCDQVMGIKQPMVNVLIMVSLTNYPMTSLCLINKTSPDLESENTRPHKILSSRKFNSQGSFSKHMITFRTTKSSRSFTTSWSMFSIQSRLASRVFYQETRTNFPPMLSQPWVTAILNHYK